MSGNRRKPNGARAYRRYYIAGLILAFVYLAAAELIWVPAPVVTRGGMEWIEWIDYLFYGLSIVPLCWFAGALRRLLSGASARVALRTVRAALAIVSAAAAATIWFAAERLELQLAGIAAGALLLFADLLLSEIASGRRMPWGSIGMLAGTLALLAFMAWPTSYNVTYPGMTMNLNRYAKVEGGGGGGVIDGVLVFDRPAVLADRLYGSLFPQYRFEPIPEDEPPLSETYAQVVAMKSDANRVAAAIAMEKAGIGNGVVPDGVRIIAVVKDSPADGALHAGDVIEALNGEKVAKVEELVAIMENAVKAGDIVQVSLRRGAESVDVAVEAAASEDDPKRSVFGISVQTEVKLDTPRQVTFNDYMAHVGGPSHGAMLTLALIDQLTPGGVTGGLRVAGTGTIEPDGSVGMVGGVPQKAFAVSRTKADVFFVPREGEEAAKSAAPGLHIVAVDTIDDVLGWLASQ
ncbi:PDZ domain-containing protein [Paenibacillus sp. LHD-117]|uniref:PDZ domain-containing protein n=1 Tax=Paenibacillus sp. LHD-117 TaxID=3071412 RepID=UPI0027DFC6EF|nr:PDZ domain-containing protein [Paenibacillus sp. LHD-117]MDQ6421832.1 PDZ domain-containing protein [Paenibacillus sp. LHD-117]